MKKVVRYLLISSFVLPILTFSKASANDDHGQHNAYGLYDRERSRDELLRNRFQQPQSYFQRLEEHRLLSPRDRFGSPGTPPSYGGGGGTPSYGGDPGSGGGGSAPIDGGISLLLAAGLGLGVKKAFNRNKASKKESSDAAE